MQLKDILDQVNSLKSEIDGLRAQHTDQTHIAREHFRTEWDFHSLNMEAVSMSREQIADTLAGDGTHGTRLERQMVRGHDKAIMHAWEHMKQGGKIDENFIRRLHEVLLVKPFLVKEKDAEGVEQERLVRLGEYKENPNFTVTRSGNVFYFAAPKDTPDKIRELLEWLNDKLETGALHPFLVAAEFHYQFSLIHPFDDGNGRLARILMNFLLVREGYPPVIIGADNTETYVSSLHLADGNKFRAFYVLIGDRLIASLKKEKEILVG